MVAAAGLLAATWAGIGGPSTAAANGTAVVTAPSGTVAGSTAWQSVSGVSVGGFAASNLRVDVVATNGLVRYTATPGTVDVTGLANDATNGKTHFATTGTEAQLNAALATLQFEGNAVGAAALQITATDQLADVTFDAANGHYYAAVVPGGGGTVPWATAVSDAAAHSITVGGSTVNGHLATITDAAENTTVADVAAGPAWIAATDAGHEGDWQWGAGPESGTTFFCDASASGCTPDATVNYANWLAAEPSNDGGNENYAVTNWGGAANHTGQWNDVPDSPSDPVTDVYQYVVEYDTGAPLAAPETAAATVNLDVTAAAAAPGAPTGVVASAGRGKATVSWTAPADNGSPITGYTVTASPGGATCTTATTSCTVTGLANDGTPYTFTVQATNGIGTSSASAPSAAVTPADAVPGYEPLAQQRLADTRLTSTPPAGGTVQVPLGSGLPAGTNALLVNLTGVDAQAAGYMTLYACGTTAPLASSLNVVPGQPVANLTLVRIPSGATDLCAYTSAAANVIVDLVGAFSGDIPTGFGPPASGSSLSGSPFVAATPARLFDSRSGGAAPPAAGTTTHVPLVSLPGVPATATSIVVNVTSDQAAARGHVTAYACSNGLPPTSSLNLDPAGATANLVVVPYTGDHELCLYAASPTHLIVDLVGSFTDDAVGGSLLVSTEHHRVLDTRMGTGGTTGPVAAGQTVTLDLAGQVSAGAEAAILNVTATASTSPGYVTVWDCSARPGTSNLNPKPGRDVPGLVVTKLGTGVNAGKVCLFTAGQTDLVVDLQGSLVPTVT